MVESKPEIVGVEIAGQKELSCIPHDGIMSIGLVAFFFNQVCYAIVLE